MTAVLALLGLGSLPFIAKIAVLFFGWTGYVLQSLYKILQLLLPPFWRWQRGERHLRKLLWPDATLPSISTLLIGIAIAVGFSLAGIFAITLLAPLLSLDPQLLRANFDARFTISPTGAVAVVVFLSAFNAILEELYFRAWFDRELSKRMGSAIGIGVSAVSFGAMHTLIMVGFPGFTWLIALLLVIGLTLVAVAWSLLQRQKGGLFAACVSHGLTDALLLGWGLHWLGYL